MICTLGQCKTPKDFIDDFAKHYREMLCPDWIGFSHGVRDQEYAAALYYAPLDDQDVVLDVGCGESAFGIYAAQNAAKVWGVDDGSWSEFVDRWEKTLDQIDEYKSGMFRYYKGNAAILPFPDCMFDKVYTFSAFEHFAGKDDICASREVARVLKPNGLFAGTIDFKMPTKNPVSTCDSYTLDEFTGRIVEPSGLMPTGDTSIGKMSPESITSLFFCLEKRNEDMGQDTKS
jgi:ubiquinone/menaquinone biosynthesis C-methylase UbiE